ncbi:MAG: hypothetical protein GC131_04485 [Alphaproteobacteria bacterium]|nr:hypothetical protein [Alphaproteobacteria bacterium]
MPYLNLDLIGLVRHVLRTIFLALVLLVLSATLLSGANALSQPLKQALAPFLLGAVPIVALLYFTHALWRDYAGGSKLGIAFEGIARATAAATSFLDDLTAWGAVRWALFAAVAVAIYALLAAHR